MKTDYKWQDTAQSSSKPFWVTAAFHQPKTNWSKDSVIIEAKYHDITFADLQLLSELFGTTDINIGSEAREGGYCDTCRHSYSVNSITENNPTKSP